MSERVEVKVFCESRYYIKCPECDSEYDVDTYEISVIDCCDTEMEFNSDPHEAEAV